MKKIQTLIFLLLVPFLALSQKEEGSAEVVVEAPAFDTISQNVLYSENDTLVIGWYAVDVAIVVQGFQEKKVMGKGSEDSAYIARRPFNEIFTHHDHPEEMEKILKGIKEVLWKATEKRLLKKRSYY